MIRHTALLIIFSSLVTAGIVVGQPVASAGMTPDARSAGLAGVSVAMDAHSMSLFGNTAAAAFSDRFTEASYGISSLGHDNWLHAVGSYFRIDEKHTVGFGVRYFSAAKVQNTLDGIEFTEVSPYDLMIDVGYAYRLGEHLALSANARYVRSKLNEGQGFKTASSVAVDVGLHYRREDFTVAATVSNLGMLVDYGVAKYRMPASARVGGAYRWQPVDGHLVTGLVEARYNFMPGDYQFLSGGVGAEYMFRGIAAVRGGYYAAGKTKGPGNYGSVGAGVYLGPITVDAAYNLAPGDSPMHNIWRVGAGVRF